MNVSARSATGSTLARERRDTYGISNLTVMGARLSVSSVRSCGWCISSTPSLTKSVRVLKATRKGRTSSHTRQAKVSSHHQVLATGQLLDPPHERRLFRNIVHGPDCGAELGRVGVFRDGDVDLDVVGGRTALELRLDLCVAKAVRTGAGSRKKKEERTRIEPASRGLLARTLTIYSIRLPECCSMSASAQIKGLT
jgi:hypothetical protein